MKLKLILSLAILNLIGSANAEVKLTPETQAFFEKARQTAKEAFEYAKTAGGELLEKAKTHLEAAKQELPKPNLANEATNLANEATCSKFKTVLSFINKNKTALAISTALIATTYVLYKRHKAANQAEKTN